MFGNDSPIGLGFDIWGEHDRGGHANYAIAPGRNIREAPVEPNLGGVRGLSAVLPDGVADAACCPRRVGLDAASATPSGSTRVSRALLASSVRRALHDVSRGQPSRRWRGPHDRARPRCRSPSPSGCRCPTRRSRRRETRPGSPRSRHRPRRWSPRRRWRARSRPRRNRGCEEAPAWAPPRQPEIHVIQRTGDDADHDLVRTGLRVGHLARSVGTGRLVEDPGVHRAEPRRRCRRARPSRARRSRLASPTRRPSIHTSKGLSNSAACRRCSDLRDVAVRHVRASSEALSCLEPVSEVERDVEDVEQSVTWVPAGRHSHRPSHSAFIAIHTRPRHHERRATTCATKTCGRPSTSTSAMSTGRVTASSV